MFRACDLRYIRAGTQSADARDLLTLLNIRDGDLQLRTTIMTDEREEILEIYQTGPLTVVGFCGREILDQIDLSQCRSEIVAILEQYHCETLAFDLTGVELVPSGMLGLLASLRKMGIEVQLYNPSADIREVLEITRLNEIMSIHEVDFSADGSPATAAPTEVAANADTLPADGKIAPPPQNPPAEPPAH